MLRPPPQAEGDRILLRSMRELGTSRNQSTLLKPQTRQDVDGCLPLLHVDCLKVYTIIWCHDLQLGLGIPGSSAYFHLKGVEHGSILGQSACSRAGTLKALTPGPGRVSAEFLSIVVRTLLTTEADTADD